MRCFAAVGQATAANVTVLGGKSDDGFSIFLVAHTIISFLSLMTFLVFCCITRQFSQ
jgi:hypothetical protein